MSDLATEREIHEFFSFSGDIDRIEIRQYADNSSVILFFGFLCLFP